jgi:hypothetical protein
VIAVVVSFARVPFDDDLFRIPRAASYFRIHIVLAIVARGKVMFTILKLTPSNYSLAKGCHAWAEVAPGDLAHFEARLSWKL